MKLSIYDRWALAVGTIGFWAVGLQVFGFESLGLVLGMSPVAAGTGLYIARKNRLDIRQEKGLRILWVSWMIGLANLGLFYAIVAALVFGVIIPYGLSVLIAAILPVLAVSPVAHLAMRHADRRDQGGPIHA